MRFIRTVRVSALVGARGLIAFPAGSAHASSSSFPMNGFYQVVADAAHNHLFLSPGSGNGNSVSTGS